MIRWRAITARLRQWFSRRSTQEVLNRDEREFFRRLDRKVDRILRLTRVSLTLELHLSKEMDDMAAEVAETNTVIESAIVLINGIAERIAAAGVDATKLAALTTELDSKSKALADAVVANTPTPPPAPGG